MAAFAPCLCLFLLLFSLAILPSGANYCVCNSGLSDSVLQKNIDYACGNGGDCSAIQPNGACFNPNTVKDHCSYAVNSYYQKKGQTSGSCDFQGTATVTPTPPSGGGSGCAFQSNPSPGGAAPTPPSTGGTAPTPPGGGGITTPPTSPGTGGTPTPPTTGGTVSPPTTPSTGGAPPSTGGITTPPTNPTTGGTPAIPFTGGNPTTPNTGTAASPGIFPGTTIPGGVGLGPTGSSFDNSVGVNSPSTSTAVTLVAFSITLLASSLYCHLIEGASLLLDSPLSGRSLAACSFV